MKKNEYLDAAKEKLKIKSDFELARQLGMSRGAINNYRKNRSNFSDYTCFQIAEILNIDAKIIIANVQAEHEKDDFRRDFWIEKLKEYGQAAIFVIVVGSTTLSMQANDLKENVASANSRNLYIMLNWIFLILILPKRPFQQNIKI